MDHKIFLFFLLQGGAIDTLRFRYDGSNILDEDTPQGVSDGNEVSLK